MESSTDQTKMPHSEPPQIEVPMKHPSEQATYDPMRRRSHPADDNDERSPLSPHTYDELQSFSAASSVAPAVPGAPISTSNDAASSILPTSISRPPPVASPSKSDPRPSSFIPRVARIRRRSPVVTVLLLLSVMATILLIILLALSLSHVLGKPVSQHIPNVDADQSRTVIPSSPIRLGQLNNFPDPALYYDASSSLWYVYGTNVHAGILPLSPGVNDTRSTNTALFPSIGLSEQLGHSIQLLSSPDLFTWTIHADPLPSLGSWVHPSTDPDAAFNSFANVWAPDIMRHPSSTPEDPTYLLYYSATSNDTPSAHCMGAATANSLTGPFKPSNEAIACPGSEGGAIDAAAFANGVPAMSNDISPTARQTLYILYKIDGNSVGNGGSCGNDIAPRTSTPIKLGRLDDTGLKLADPVNEPPTTILDLSTEDGDGPLVEAPSLIKVDGTYVLFYSSGCTREDSYNIKYATSESIAGPYQRRGRLLATGDYGLVAPGSVSVRVAKTGEGSKSAVGGNIGQSTDEWVMAFAARTTTRLGGVRALYTVGLGIGADGGVSLKSSTT